MHELLSGVVCQAARPWRLLNVVMTCLRTWPGAQDGAQHKLCAGCGAAQQRTRRPLEHARCGAAHKLGQLSGGSGAVAARCCLVCSRGGSVRSAGQASAQDAVTHGDACRALLRQQCQPRPAAAAAARCTRCALVPCCIQPCCCPVQLMPQHTRPALYLHGGSRVVVSVRLPPLSPLPFRSLSLSGISGAHRGRPDTHTRSL